MAYVLSHDDLHQHLESTVAHQEEAGGGGEGALDSGTGGERGLLSPSRETPEDLVEVLCGDRVLEPHLYIGETRIKCVSKERGGERVCSATPLRFRSL